MKLKRILAITSTLVTAVSLTVAAGTFTAVSASATDLSEFVFSIDGDGNATVTDHVLYSRDIVIPDAFEGHPVTTIASYAFEADNLNSVTIPETVTTIGESAFESNNLTSVIVPSRVSVISASAFNSNRLTSITLPTGVTSIEQQAFEQNSLTSIVIPAGVTTIGYAAFGTNPTLETVTFLGDAPTVVAAADGGSFDMSNVDFVLANPRGNLTYGTEATWNGYRLLYPNPNASPSGVMAGITAGTRSASLGLVAFEATSFSHAEQYVDIQAVLTLDDLTGANVGWNVTESVSSLIWTASVGGPPSGVDLPASALSVNGVGEVVTTAGDVWNGQTATGSLDSPVKVLSTAGGSGAYNTQLTLRLTVPGQATVGTYAGTITTTVSLGP